ncbi:achaete-scute homolog 4 [Vulpes lagopus]|uniref:achaete-scute homolog 4 n=1 Tax=Vulpes lagopus TaxID=494514 RepID=UPI001BC9E8C0|nr:achaete-scute homolog 4 [Vulpes lagopus]
METRRAAGPLPSPRHLRTAPPDLPGALPRLPLGDPPGVPLRLHAACWARARARAPGGRGPGLALPLPLPLACALEPAFLRRRNERERQRVRGVNEGYARLRDHLPRELAQRRLSKVETLRAAIRYIRHLQELLERQARAQEGPAAARTPRPADCNSDGESKASSAPSPCSEPEEAGS